VRLEDQAGEQIEKVGEKLQEAAKGPGNDRPGSLRATQDEPKTIEILCVMYASAQSVLEEAGMIETGV